MGRTEGNGIGVLILNWQKTYTSNGADSIKHFTAVANSKLVCFQMQHYTRTAYYTIWVINSSNQH